MPVACSGDYHDFIIACLRGDRLETAAPDATLAGEQAAALHEAAQGWGTNESVFVDILSKASVEQTNLIEQVRHTYSLLTYFPVQS